jgi:DNA-binding protein YbaB
VTIEHLGVGGEVAVAEPNVSADQQIQQLYAEADSTMAQLKDRMASVRQAQQEALQATGEASSQDGTVRAVVDSTGVVTSLTIAPSVFERTTPERLAQTVVATIQRAAAQSRGRMSAAMAPTAPEEGLSAKAAEALAEYGIPKVGVPEVPHTAVDPTLPDTTYEQPPVNTAKQDAWANGHAVDVEPEQAPVPVPEPIRVPRASKPVLRPARQDADESAFDEERPW